MFFKKDILVKYLNYKYYHNPEFSEVFTIRKIDIRINFSSIFFVLLSYKINGIKQNLVYDNVYYSIEDFNNTCYNLEKNKIFVEENTRSKKEIKENHITDYLDFFFKELFGEYKTGKEKAMKYNFDKNKFKQYFKSDSSYNFNDKYNSNNRLYSRKEIEEKEQKIYNLKRELELCKEEKEKFKNQNLDLQAKINDYEKQLQKFNQLKDLLKEIFN